MLRSFLGFYFLSRLLGLLTSMAFFAVLLVGLGVVSTHTALWAMGQFLGLLWTGLCALVIALAHGGR
jgi:hypothetical protein